MTAILLSCGIYKWARVIEWSAARTRARRCGEVERERKSLEAKSTCGCGVGLLVVAAAVIMTSEMALGVDGASEREDSGKRYLSLREASAAESFLARADSDTGMLEPYRLQYTSGRNWYYTKCIVLYTMHEGASRVCYRHKHFLGVALSQPCRLSEKNTIRGKKDSDLRPIYSHFPHGIPALSPVDADNA